MDDRQASDDDQAAMITVEVAYATPARQLIVPLVVPEGTTAYEAVQRSNIAAEFSEIDIDNDPMGIFSQAAGWQGQAIACRVCDECR